MDVSQENKTLVEIMNCSTARLFLKPKKLSCPQGIAALLLLLLLFYKLLHPSQALITVHSFNSASLG